MKLEKAIEIKEQHLRDNQPYDLEELEEADKLSIEALRCLERLHHLPYGSPVPPLPGETTEEEPERSHDVADS